MGLILNGGISGTGTSDAAVADFTSPTLPSVISLPFTMSAAYKQGSAVSASHVPMALTVKGDATAAANYTTWMRVNRATGPILLASNMHQTTATAQVVNAGTGPTALITGIVGNGTTIEIFTDGVHPFVTGDWIEVTSLSSYAGINGDCFPIVSTSPSSITIAAVTTGTYVYNAGDKVMYAPWTPGDVWNIIVATFRDINTAPTRQVFSGVLLDGAFRRKTDGSNNSGSAGIVSNLSVADRISFGAIIKDAFATGHSQGILAQEAIWSGKLATEAEAEELLTKAPADVSWGAPTLLWTFIGNGNEANGGPTATPVGSATFDSSTPIYPSGDLPTVTVVSPATFVNGASVTISGLNFGAAQGSGSVIISPTNDVDDVDAEEQTVTAWADAEITITTVRGALAYSTPMYLFVINDDADSNASGSSVQFNMVVVIRENLVNLAGSSLGGETGITAFIWTSAPSSSNSVPDQVLSNQTTDGSGLTAWAIDGSDLEEDDPIWVVIFKDGTPYRASMRKLTPSYE
jgi:hypothetical protein